VCKGNDSKFVGKRDFRRWGFHPGEFQPRGIDPMSPAGPVNMRRSRTPVAYSLGCQSKRRVEIWAVYHGSCKPLYIYIIGNGCSTYIVSVVGDCKLTFKIAVAVNP